MNTIVKIIVCALAVCSSIVAYGQKPYFDSIASGRKTVTLSREECIRIALQDNPTIKVGDMEIDRMEYAKKGVIGGLLPNINFTGAYQRTIELQTISMNMGGQSQEIKMGMDNSWNFGFTASMPLVAPTLWKSIQMSDTQILASLEDARASRLNLVNQVDKAYYSLLLAHASQKVIKENYDVAVYNAETYAKQYALGTATEYDVLRSSVQVKNVEPELLQAEIAIRQCCLQLKVLMGMSDEIDIRPDVTLDQMRSKMEGYTDNLDRSLADNTSIQSLGIQTRLLKQNLDSKKFEFLPTLSAQFNISWSALSNGNALKNQKFHPYSTAGLSLSVPIFSGGSRYYGMKGAEVQLKEMSLQREDLENSLNMQVDLAIDNINKELRQINSSSEGVNQAVKAHEIMQKSFEIGAATYLNLRDAELAETTAKLSYYQAIYNYLVSTSELDLLLGRRVK